MGYKITSENSKTNISIWDIEAEFLIALLAKRLNQIRNKNSLEVINNLNFEYLNKTGKTNKSNYSATKLQRDVINEVGY